MPHPDPLRRRPRPLKQEGLVVGKCCVRLVVEVEQHRRLAGIPARERTPHPHRVLLGHRREVVHLASRVVAERPRRVEPVEAQDRVGALCRRPRDDPVEVLSIRSVGQRPMLVDRQPNRVRAPDTHDLADLSLGDPGDLAAGRAHDSRRVEAAGSLVLHPGAVDAAEDNDGAAAVVNDAVAVQPQPRQLAREVHAHGRESRDRGRDADERSRRRARRPRSSARRSRAHPARR